MEFNEVGGANWVIKVTRLLMIRIDRQFLKGAMKCIRCKGT